MKFSVFFKRFYPYLKSHFLKLIVVTITMVLATTLETYLPKLTGEIVDNLFSNDGESLATYYSFLVFGVIFISSIFAFISTNISSIVSNRVVMDIRIEMFAKLLKLPKKYFDNNNSGKILSKLTYDVEQISSVASTLWLELIRSSLMVVILIVQLFLSSWQLSLSLIVIMPLIFLTVKSSSARIKKASTMVQESMGEVTHHIGENIIANSMVKIYQMFGKSTAKFNKLANTIRHKTFRVDNTSAINTFVVNTLIGSSLGLVVYLSTTLNMTAGEFIAFFTAMGMLIKPAKTLVGINKPLQKALAAGKSVFGFLDEKVEKTGKQDADIKGRIEFKNVGFAYNSSPALKDISFVINEGESLALVGSTGSGKSTIAALIAKFYTHKSGEILIDGVSIKDIKLETLRKNISLVEQKINLFTGTIAENIMPNILNPDTSSINKYIDSAGASEFVNQLDDGINSTIGNNGVTLSGGQAQRLSIARAIAKNSPILILDEATSALDSKTEKEVQNAINKLQQGKTTIIIAHRLSTIKNADNIAVVKDGVIVEIGSHEILMNLKGEYYQLNSQLSSH